MTLLLGLISYLLTLLINPFIKNLLIESNCTVENYKGKKIPVGMGIVFLVNFIIIAIIITIDDDIILYLYLICILSMGFTGIIDDLIGNKEASGFSGHIGMLLKGKLTTGGFKALIGGLISILIALKISEDINIVLLNLLLIALFTNLVNLLDLRPGRALKFFFVNALLLFVLVNNNYVKYILASNIGASLSYFPYDIKAVSMLGDVGSNILGVTLGLGSVFLPIQIKIILVFFLIAANLYSEKRSISKLILKNKILNYIDNIGR